MLDNKVSYNSKIMNVMPRAFKVIKIIFSSRSIHYN
jgi:hypothetical protein